MKKNQRNKRKIGRKWTNFLGFGQKIGKMRKIEKKGGFIFFLYPFLRVSLSSMMFSVRKTNDKHNVFERKKGAQILFTKIEILEKFVGAKKIVHVIEVK